MGQKREACFAVIGEEQVLVFLPTCNALCVCVLILVSYEISRRDNYPHDSFSTAPVPLHSTLYTRWGGGGGRVDG